MDDPFSLLGLAVWLMAAGMWPLGIGYMFGVCSACCGCCCDKLGDYQSVFFGDNGEFYSWFAAKQPNSGFTKTAGCGENSATPPDHPVYPERNSYAPFYRRPACVWSLCRCISGGEVACTKKWGGVACEGEIPEESTALEYLENKIKECLGDPIPFEVDNGDGCYLYHVQFYAWVSRISPERKAEREQETNQNEPNTLGICASDKYDVRVIKLGTNGGECPIPPEQ